MAGQGYNAAASGHNWLFPTPTALPCHSLPTPAALLCPLQQAAFVEAETIKRQEALLHEEEQAAAEEEQRAAARAEVRWALGTSVWRGAFEHVLLAAKWRQRAAAAY